jgi:hypothetical protein
MMAMLAESECVAQPVLHKIFLSGGLALGPVPTEAAIDAHLAQIPEGIDVDADAAICALLQVEWIVVPMRSTTGR